MGQPRKKGRGVTRRAPATARQKAPQEPLVDPRIRPLLERYVSAVDAELTEIGQGLVELRLPAAEREWFQDRSSLRIAFTLDALESDPEAEIAVVGSTLVEQLVAAIRARGSRLSHGPLKPEHEPDATAAELRIPITNGSASAPRVDVAWHRIVRLIARVVVRAGGEVEEHLLESDFFDATTGIAVPAEVAAQCGTRAAGAGARGTRSSPRAPSRSTPDLISLGVAALQRSFQPKVARLRQEAARKLREELERIDGYYASLLSDAPRREEGDVAESAARRAVEAEHARRRAEEERRHQVRVIVHPVQLVECELLVQRAKWNVASPRGVHAQLVAERWLNGAGDWSLACPHCAAPNPATLSLCTSAHLACDACGATCGVCAESFCRDHGVGACHVDGRPACAEHARTCSSCQQSYCTEHEAICADGDHAACSACVMECVLCGRSVCAEHAATTAATSPHGERRLCGECVRACEGGSSEPVGADEVTRCTSCEKLVCESHRSACDVDQSVHCSKHLRPTDGTRRLVCENHRDECVLEPGVVFATDEVEACATCGRHVCGEHSNACAEDGQLHCDEDLLKLRNEPGKFLCRGHASVCHVDKGAYRAGDTEQCPVCDKAACKNHLRSCTSCGRTVCVRDFDATQSWCITCARMRELTDPPETLLAAVTAAVGRRPTPKRWRSARDATHTVVEVDLGWRKRLVLAVRHDSNAASTGLIHTAMGAQKLKSA